MKVSTLEKAIANSALIAGIVMPVAGFYGVYYFGDNINHVERFSTVKVLFCAGLELLSPFIISGAIEYKRGMR